MFSFNAAQLWDYSLQVYQQEELKNALLTLQDEMQINVNLVLSMMFLCKHQRMYRFEDIEELEQAIAKSDLKLKRHRAKRRNLKHVDENLYKEALTQELALEKAQQEEIAESASGLFFHYMGSYEQLSDQLSALCLQKLNKLREMQNAALDTRTLSAAVLSACAAVSQHV